MKGRILLIEDEEAIAVPLADRLRSEDYCVDIALNGQQGFELALSKSFDLIVLDLMLPGKSGLNVCADLRRERVTIPVIILSAKGQVTDKVVGLGLGADDYMTKPFEFTELLARVEALLRRASSQTDPSSGALQFGCIRIYKRQAEVWRSDEQVVLSPKEFQLLCFLAEHPNTVHSREDLLREVWGYGAEISTRTIDVHIGWLRQKLEDNPRQPQLIQTVIGSGYKLSK